MRALLALLLVLLGAWLAHAARAHAQASPIAEALFRAGRDASARGDHATACAKYRESQRIEKAPGTLLNIAVCEEALGELASAWLHYQEAMHAFEPSDARQGLARERLSALEQRLPKLSVLLASGASPATRVEIDGVRLSEASFGVPIPRDPGAYALDVVAEGHALRRYEVTLAEGEERTLYVEAGAPVELSLQPSAAAVRATLRAPVEAAAPARALARDEESAALRTAGYVALGTGAAALLASGVAFALAVDRKASVDAHCTSRMCDDEGLEAGREGETFLAVSWVSLAAGVAASALGAIALF